MTTGGRSHRATQQRYDRLARWYGLVTALERPARQAGLRLLAARPGEHILEVGHGPGAELARIAAATQPGGRAIGVDVSAGMQRVARRRLRRHGLTETAHLVRGDATRLPVRDGAVDVVFMSFTLELFDDDEQAVVVRECRRVLTDGGRLVVVSLTSHGKPTTARRLYERAHRRWPGLVDCRPIPVSDVCSGADLTPTATQRVHIAGLPVDILRLRRDRDPASLPSVDPPGD